VLNTKSRLLCYLKPILSCFKVPNLIFFDAVLLRSGQLSPCEKIRDVFNGKKVAIRSSAADEDGSTNSFAGEYASILNIPSDNSKRIEKAINTVIESYEKKRKLLPNDEVIVQDMVQNTTMSGVIFTHDLNTGAPYYVINYDDQSGLTDTVTSGGGEYSNRTLYIHRNSIDKLRSERFIKLLQAVQELEKIMESQFLDIEFALGEDLTPYLLQVRAITTQPNWNRAVAKKIDVSLQGVQSFVIERFKRIDGVYGETTLLGQMPDWNPVEMIGRAPRALASSLYQILITNNVWRDARKIMGYAIPKSQSLMVMLAGQPFIDTRLSFHSYLPKTISPSVSEKLVNHWVDRLKNNPELHDKVEFEVAITTYSFDIDEKIEQLIGNVLTTPEKEKFKQAHCQQTIQLVKGEREGSLKQALDKINLLNKKHTDENNLDLQDNLLLLPALINDCINLGTIPFAILARHGFIAKTILISLKQQNIITQDEFNQIHASVQTVASDLVNDMTALQVETISTASFMEKYGHLRPGTYDIMSRRYDQMSNLSNGVNFNQSQQQFASFQFSNKQKQQINELLREEGFGGFNTDDLLSYINDAITGREYGKFVFTRSVSNILELIARFSESNGLSRDEISHVPINMLLKVVEHSDENSIERKLRKISEQEAEKHDVSVAIRLPQLLTDQAGVYIVPFQVSHPNFITHKKITAPSIVLCSDFNTISLNGKVVIIEGADPGFDWIFSQNIAGLITKYGGANSHMAIRCAEFKIPAAIGCGDQRFELLLKASHVYLDCASSLVYPVH
jgi:phosphohistidine swiveling domain-containing protein